MISATNPIVLDTDIYSEVAQGVDRRVVARAADHRASGAELAIWMPSVIEIVAGWQQRGRVEKIEPFIESLNTIEVLPLSQSAAVVGA